MLVRYTFDPEKIKHVIDIDVSMLLRYETPEMASSMLFSAIQDRAIEITQSNVNQLSDEFRLSAIEQMREALPLYRGNTFLPAVLEDFIQRFHPDNRPPPRKGFWSRFGL